MPSLIVAVRLMRIVKKIIWINPIADGTLCFPRTALSYFLRICRILQPKPKKCQNVLRIFFLKFKILLKLKTHYRPVDPIPIPYTH